MILSIDTALEMAEVCVADGNRILAVRQNGRQADHASWIHTAIAAVMQEAGAEMKMLKAVAVTEGPGSYTGLRVGMATAKGLCYSLGIPLITASTLLLMARIVKKEMSEKNEDYDICPMIDARRMEVFTILYDNFLEVKMPASAMILNEHSFREILDAGPVVFCGNGAAKWRPVCIHANALFSDSGYDVRELAALAQEKFDQSIFTDLAYSEPNYLKNVHIN